MVHSKLSYSSLPTSFWEYAIQTDVYLLNNIVSKFVPKTPYKFWTRRKVSINHLHIWGCLVHVLKGKTDKMEPHIDAFIFMGYPRGTRGYLFYNPTKKKVFVNTNTKFSKKDCMNNHKPKSKVIV